MPSIGDRGDKGRSPNPGNRLINQQTENSDDDYNSRSGVGLTRDNKHTRSNRKIKPMYGLGNNQSRGMLKVVHEDEHSSANENIMPYLSKGNNNLGSLMSIVSTNSGGN